jgi:hypothetical protein
MSIARTIIYISILFWLLPPFRQFRCKIFFYFLILALADPIALFLIKVLDYSPQIIHPIAGFLLFYSINFSLSNLKRYWIIHLIFISGFSISLFYFDNILYVLLVIHFLILFKFLRIVLTATYNNGYINIFYLALSFYELSVIVNLAVLLSGSNLHIVMYYITLAFQTLLAIFFTIFTEKSRFLIIPLKSAE